MCCSVGGSQGHDDPISMLKSRDFTNTSLESLDGARYHKCNKSYAFKGRNTRPNRVSVSMGAFINML